MDNTEILKTFAASVVEHMNALGYKGKRRDETALDCIIAAGSLIESMGDLDLAKRLETMAYLVSVRGYSTLTTWGAK